MRRRRYVSQLGLCVLASAGMSGNALAQSVLPDPPLTAEAKHQIVETLIGKLDAYYVFPGVAQEIKQDLTKSEQKGVYKRVTSGQVFAELLTDELRQVSHDKHLGVEYHLDPVTVSMTDKPGSTPADEREQRRQFGEHINFCFDKVERMPGNIGYLELRCFDDPEFASETAVAAMQFLANSYSVVIDLRRNRGGDPGMVQLLATYLFGSKPVHLNDIYSRATNTTASYWTLPYVPGRRLTGKNIWILTSSRTFSAGEEFAYDLKSLKRATIVGESTGGGANPGEDHVLNDHFVAFIPFGRAINPITKSNWEGTGVIPDVPVKADEALNVAYLAALRQAEVKETEPHLQAEIRTAIADVQKAVGNQQK